MDDEEGWTPVMKRKTVHEIAWSESSTSDSEVYMYRVQERWNMRRLNIYIAQRTRPFTPIRAGSVLNL